MLAKNKSSFSLKEVNNMTVRLHWANKGKNRKWTLTTFSNESLTEKAEEKEMILLKSD